MSPCLTGSAVDRMMEAIEFSEANRRRVSEIVESYRPGTERQIREQFRLRGQPLPSPRELDYYVQQRAASDPKFTLAINNERWGWRLATLYAAQVQLEVSTTTNRLLEALLAETAETRRLLERAIRLGETIAADAPT